MKNSKKIRPRITSGLYKFRRLDVPNVSRPVTERVKLTIFDILREHIDGAKCVDLFAGSGNIGIEALSRGASFVSFVDKDLNSIKIIKQNLENLKVDHSQFSVYKGDYLKFVASNEIKYNIVFADPPFDKFESFKTNRLLSLLEPLGILVLKIPAFTRNKALEILRESIVIEKQLGKNKIVIIQKK